MAGPGAPLACGEGLIALLQEACSLGAGQPLNASPSPPLHHWGVLGRSLDLSGPQSAHL